MMTAGEGMVDGGGDQLIFLVFGECGEGIQYKKYERH